VNSTCLHDVLLACQHRESIRTSSLHHSCKFLLDSANVCQFITIIFPAKPGVCKTFMSVEFLVLFWAGRGGSGQEIRTRGQLRSTASRVAAFTQAALPHALHCTAATHRTRCERTHSYSFETTVSKEMVHLIFRPGTPCTTGLV